MIKNRGAFVSRSSHPLGCIPHQKVDFFDIALEALHVAIIRKSPVRRN